MTGIPGIYGPLTDHEKAAYARWIMALFDLAEHVDTCSFRCEDGLYVCPEGREKRDTEQQRHHELRAAVRDAEQINPIRIEGTP